MFKCRIKIMKAIIPYTVNKFPEQVVLDSITSQGISYEAVDCTIEGNYHKYVRISIAKEKLRKYAMTLKEDFLIFNDRDIKSLRNDNFSRGLDFLINNKNYGAVAFSRENKSPTSLVFRRRSDHICNGSMIVRSSVLDKLSFALFMPMMLPDCHSVGLSLQKAGYLYGYLDGLKRVEHLEKNWSWLNDPYAHK